VRDPDEEEEEEPPELEPPERAPDELDEEDEDELPPPPPARGARREGEFVFWFGCGRAVRVVERRESVRRVDENFMFGDVTIQLRIKVEMKLRFECLT